ncbi:MAG TPA: carboxypeptidase-like regulatory domain-containing protein [Kofleriaceae bacterium]
MLVLIASCGAPPKLATCSQHAGIGLLRQLDDPDNGEVGGSVTDSATCAPLAGIAIDAVSPRGELSLITNDEGRYLATRLAPGTYTLSLRVCDVTIQRDVAITGGYATQLDFAMNQKLCAER